MRFEIDAKELKEMVGEIAPITKKGYTNSSRVFYFSTSDRDVYVTGYNINIVNEPQESLKVKANTGYAYEEGKMKIAEEDIKLLVNMKGGIVVTNNEEEGKGENKRKIQVTNGKRKINLSESEVEEPVFLKVNEGNDKLVFPKNWLNETLVNEEKLIASENKKDDMLVASMIHFNEKMKRVEIADGIKIGIRNFPLSYKAVKGENNKGNGKGVRENNICIPASSVPVLSKTMKRNGGNKGDKGDRNEVIITWDDEKVEVKGENFVYVTTKFIKEFYDVSRIYQGDNEYTNYFSPDKDEMVEMLQYVNKITKGDKKRKPLFLHLHNNTPLFYYENTRCEGIEKIAATSVKGNGGYVGFNPDYMLQIFSVVGEKVVFEFKEERDLIIVKDEKEGREDYVCVLCPVNIKNREDGVEVDCEALKRFKERVKEM